MNIKYLDKPSNIVPDYYATKVCIDTDILYTHFTVFDPNGYPNLKYVLCPCTGVEHLKFLAYRSDIKLIYLDDKEYLAKNVWSTAEHTVSLILQCCKLARKELRKSVIGYIGYGRVAKQVEQLLKGFEVNLMYFDKENLYNCSLESIATNADIISVHLAENEETKDLLGPQFFGLIRSNNPIFINTARAAIVNEHALCTVIDTGVLSAVGLDVTEGYSNTTMNYLNYGPYKDRIILTPHIAGKSDISRYQTDKYVFNKLNKELENDKTNT